ncbi:MAG: hypothetical protein HY692_03190 [Cyanobacteria bacterium NC_groundwater_1444_Ag_S-0.65um_54_12]|nr:hypothetical protein [Cyanobacteria bacterium NC_groundwater_1444_Ag_S-0.65um_54_12]
MPWKTIAGVILLAIGILDLLRFGIDILFKSPLLILGLLFTVGGASLLSAGIRERRLRP